MLLVKSLKYVCVFIYVCGLTACKTTENGSTSKTRSLNIPPAGATNVPLDRAIVTDALVQAHEAFYKNKETYSQLAYGMAGTEPTMPAITEPQTCYSACPAGRWSKLMCTYYCQFSGYSSVIPNIRGCL